jgi:hypothetical protein
VQIHGIAGRLSHFRYGLDLAAESYCYSADEDSMNIQLFTKARSDAGEVRKRKLGGWYSAGSCGKQEKG